MKFKICLIGDPGVGKSSYLSMLKDGVFTKKYSPTPVGGQLSKLTFNTNHGEIDLIVKDLSGKDKYKSPIHITDGALFFCCNDSRISAKNYTLWQKWFIKHNNSPTQDLIVAVCNKCELVPKFDNNDFINISVSTGENLFSPITQLLKFLTNKDDIVIRNIT